MSTPSGSGLPPEDGDAPVEKLTRRRFVGSIAGLALGGGALEGLVLEPRRVAVTHHVLGRPPEARAGPPPLRLVQLSDLHLGSVGRFHEEIATKVEALAPDAILLTGDAIDREDALPLLEAFLSLLPIARTQLATMGNWEYWSGVDLTRLTSVYERAGYGLLVNQSETVVHGGREALIVGLDDLLVGRPDLARAQPSPDMVASNVLLVSHCPAYRDQLPDGSRAVAMLSGHTHGGQLAIGRWAPVRPPGSGPYVAGWYGGPGPDLYVSRGLGTSVVPLRLGSVPEVACFDWFLEPA